MAPWVLASPHEGHCSTACCSYRAPCQLPTFAPTITLFGNVTYFYMACGRSRAIKRLTTVNGSLRTCKRAWSQHAAAHRVLSNALHEGRTLISNCKPSTMAVALSTGILAPYQLPYVMLRWVREHMFYHKRARHTELNVQHQLPVMCSLWITLCATATVSCNAAVQVCHNANPQPPMCGRHMDSKQHPGVLQR